MMCFILSVLSSLGFIAVMTTVFFLSAAKSVYAAVDKEGDFVLRVDLGCRDNPKTFKSGWVEWALPNACDGQPHGVEYLRDIDGTGVDACLRVHDATGGNVRWISRSLRGPRRTGSLISDGSLWKAVAARSARSGLSSNNTRRREAL